MNDNIQSPDFSPSFPNYPEVGQVVRVTGPAVDVVKNIYPGIIEQYGGSLNFRDRVNCYIQEPNGIKLATGFYSADLVGSYLGLPLLAVTCCPVASSSSSKGA